MVTGQFREFLNSVHESADFRENCEIFLPAKISWSTVSLGVQLYLPSKSIICCLILQHILPKINPSFYNNSNHVSLQ